MDGQKTATCRKLFEPGGIRYQFFCDVSGALVCTTDVLPDDEPVRAWKDEAKKHFSRCQRCGRWVSDPMYCCRRGRRLYAEFLQFVCLYGFS